MNAPAAAPSATVPAVVHDVVEGSAEAASRSLGDAAAIKREVVRRYGAVARGGAARDPAPEPGTGGCCAPSAVPSGCCGESAGAAAATREFDLGCGNPLPFAGIRPGHTVLDLGSGSCAEVLRAARLVGPSGRAVGVDLTPDMLELSRRNAAASGATNVSFLEGDVESLPLPDASVDVIVSNCVLNLTPSKIAAFQEAFRVLRPGGRFVVADIVIAGGREPDPAWRGDLAAWSACVRGAMTEEAYERGLREAGFSEVVLERIAAAPTCGDGGTEVEIVSDLISARKPWSDLEPLPEDALPEVHALLREAALSELGVDAAGLASGRVRVFGLRGAADGGGRRPLLATGAWESAGTAVLVRSIAVRRDLRETGLGGRVLEELLELAREEGAREALLFTESAEGFFARRGWQRVPREVLAERFPSSDQVRTLCSASAVSMRRDLAGTS